jgi:saxitoxin biosynthesis operon SxtJ-like protein
VAGPVPARLSRAEGRKFGLTVGIAFLALAGLLIWRAKPVGAAVAGTLGTLLVLGGLVIPTRLGPVERGWMRLAQVISRVTTPVFMAIVYFLVITPIGWIVRLAGHRPLVRTAADGSYWVSRRPGERQSTLSRQF